VADHVLVGDVGEQMAGSRTIARQINRQRKVCTHATRIGVRLRGSLEKQSRLRRAIKIQEDASMIGNERRIGRVHTRSNAHEFIGELMVMEVF